MFAIIYLKFILVLVSWICPRVTKTCQKKERIAIAKMKVIAAAVTDQEQNSEDEGLRFANRREIASDHRFYRYEALYSWLYYNHSLNGYMCKLCEVFYAGMSCSTGSHRGAWSHKGVNFKDNAGKKLRPKNATYTSHETCDSLIHSLDTFFWKQTEERMQRVADLVLFADESSNAARSETLGIFISSFDDKNKRFHMDFVSLVEVSSTSSEIVMDAVATVMKDRDIDIKKTRFSCLDGTNSMPGVHNGLQRRIQNYAPHVIYINC